MHEKIAEQNGAAWTHRMLISTDVDEDMYDVKRLAGNAPALKMVKSGFPKFTSSSSVGRMSILYMKRAWYALAHRTRTLMRDCTSMRETWSDGAHTDETKQAHQDMQKNTHAMLPAG